jgi:pseudouridine synthase
MEKERLNRFLARAGVASRRACDRLIQEGRVRVNGVPVSEPGTRIDPDADRVECGGRAVRPPDACTYVVLNKPAGYLVSAGDPHHDRTVFDLLDGLPARVFPVGRLDIDTTGVLLLTDDGNLAYRLTHPRFGVGKTYVARLDTRPSEAALQALRDGVNLDDGPTAPAGVRRAGESAIELLLHEGRNRQVRRMCESVGLRVEHLERTRFGTLGCEGLARGSWRPLRPAEVASLREAAGVPGERHA